MTDIAELEQYDLAETWWRRVVAYSLRIPSYQPSSILLACLQVVNNIKSSRSGLRSFRAPSTSAPKDTEPRGAGA